MNKAQVTTSYSLRRQCHLESLKKWGKHGYDSATGSHMASLPEDGEDSRVTRKGLRVSCILFTRVCYHPWSIVTEVWRRKRCKASGCVPPSFHLTPSHPPDRLHLQLPVTINNKLQSYWEPQSATPKADKQLVRSSDRSSHSQTRRLSRE